MLTVLVQRHGSPQKITPTSGGTAFEKNGTSTAPFPLTGIQVAVQPVHEAHEQHWAPQANRLDSNFSGQLHEKPHELVIDLVCDHDMKGGAEK